MLHKVQRQDENQLRESLSPGHWPIKDRHSLSIADAARSKGGSWPTMGSGTLLALALSSLATTITAQRTVASLNEGWCAPTPSL